MLEDFCLISIWAICLVYVQRCTFSFCLRKEFYLTSFCSPLWWKCFCVWRFVLSFWISLRWLSAILYIHIHTVCKEEASGFWLLPYFYGCSNTCVDVLNQFELIGPFSLWIHMSIIVKRNIRWGFEFISAGWSIIMWIHIHTCWLRMWREKSQVFA